MRQAIESMYTPRAMVSGLSRACGVVVLLREKLYVYGMSNGTMTLAVADPSTLVLSEVGPVTAVPQLFPGDMQGDALGHLFVLSRSGQLLELDSASAKVLSTTRPHSAAGLGRS